MNKNEFLTLNDEQVEHIVAAHHQIGHPPKLPPLEPEPTTLAVGEEGPCPWC